MVDHRGLPDPDRDRQRRGQLGQARAEQAINGLGDAIDLRIYTACQAAGLAITAVREPRIAFEHPFRGYPAVLVIQARRL